MRTSIILEHDNRSEIVDFTRNCRIVRDGTIIAASSSDDKLSISMESSGSLSCALSIHFAFPSFSRERIFVPAVWYGGNTEGEGCFPSEEKSRYWTFLETRMPIPGLIGYQEDDGWTFIWMDECGSSLALASAGWDEKGIIYRIPGHENPYSYNGKTKLSPAGSAPLLSIPAGAFISRSFHTYRSSEIHLYAAYKKLIERFFNSGAECNKSWKEYETSKLRHLLSLVIRTDDDNATLIMGKGNGEHQSVYEFTAGSFLVKALEGALSFLHTDKALFLSPAVISETERISTLFGIEKEAVREEIPMRIGKYFLRCCDESGFYQDSISLSTGERGGYLGISEHPEFRFLMNARCSGEAVSAYIELYKSTDCRAFLELSLRVMRYFIKVQLEDGSFGRWWDKNGKAIDRKGTNGAYIALALLKAMPFIESEEEREKWRAAIKRALAYYTSLSLSDSFHGDTLDADSTDKEAGVSILSFLIKAIEEGYGDENTLQAAINAASFILTWIWQADSYLPSSSPLGKLGFSTAGMTSVSVAHHHLDFYGMLIAELFLRLEEITDDPLWKTQAIKMMNACLQLIANEGNAYLGRSNEYSGWQPEQINHTAWDYFSNEANMNGTYSIDIAWVNVLGYSSYLSIRDEFPDIFL